MNIRHSKPAFTTLFAAIALVSASFAGAAESGLSHNEQAAQNAIVGGSSVSAVGRGAGVATLAQNEAAAQRAIVVDYAVVSNPIAVAGETVALVANEQAAQRAIVDAPRANRSLSSSVAATPVAVR